jgi:hypothetical protein
MWEGGIRATSRTRLRARDHLTSSTFIGGKGGIGPTALQLRLRDRWSIWMQDGYKAYTDSYMTSNMIMLHGHLDYIQKPPLGGRPNTKLGDHGSPIAHNRWFILCYHMWGPAWIEIHWNIIWFRTWSHMTSHYTWGSVTTLHEFGGVSGRPLNTFSWALTISWSRLSACVWSGPHIHIGTRTPTFSIPFIFS